MVKPRSSKTNSELISVMEWRRSWPLKNLRAGVTLSISTSSFDAAEEEADDDDGAPLGLVVAVTVTSGRCAASDAAARASRPLVDDDDFLLALPGPLPTTGDPAYAFFEGSEGGN